MQKPSPSEEAAAVLAKISSRPKVVGTLILSRDTGAIVRSSGLATDEEDGESEPVPPGSSHGQSNGVDGEAKKKKGTRKAEEVARIVWKFIGSAEELIEDLQGEADEAKLLRIRTKKNEIMIMPEAKFLHVVLHETPLA